MKTAIHHAKVYVEKGHFEEALLIEDGIIKMVGSNQDILAAASGAEEIDAQGHTVVPGFIDSHLHMYNVGFNLRSIILMGATSIAECIQRSRDFLEKNKPAPGSVIAGRGWNHDYFTDEHRMLNRHDLDQITTEHALVFARACGHVTVVNSKALEMAGITRDTPQVPGGEFELDENGEPNGVFKELAAALVQKLLAQPEGQDLEDLLRAGMEHAAEWGITSIQSNDIKNDNYERIYGAYQSMVDKGTALVRTYHQCNFTTLPQYEDFLAHGYKTGYGCSMNKIGPLKLFIDGSLGARTALMRQDYNDAPGVRGIEVMTQEQLNAFVKTAQANHMQVAVHAIGDRGIEMVLNAYDTVIEGGKNDLRHGIVHCQITDLPLLERFQKNDIIAYIQPIFLHYDLHIVEDRVGKPLTSTSYAFHTMEKLGLHTCYGTDSPVEDLNTMDNIHCAVNRQDLKGFPEGGFYPEERIDVSDAIDEYTIGCAYTSFEEDVKGRLKPGYYADLAILSDDIFTVPTEKIRDIRVLTTMVGGKVTFQR